jgi:hypothetical protein
MEEKEVTTAMIVKGMVFKNGDGEQQKLVVRFTSDELGETFSISNDKDLMLLIDFEGVEKFIEANRDLNGWRRKK